MTSLTLVLRCKNYQQVSEKLMFLDHNYILEEGGGIKKVGLLSKRMKKNINLDHDPCQ